jgi:hypothetical protein
MMRKIPHKLRDRVRRFIRSHVGPTDFEQTFQLYLFTKLDYYTQALESLLGKDKLEALTNGFERDWEKDHEW